MLVNFRNAFVNIMQHPEKESTTFARANLWISIHTMAAFRLLSVLALGRVRHRFVRISGSHYVPLADSRLLERERNKLLKTARHFDNPFDQTVYVHCNLAYL